MTHRFLSKTFGIVVCVFLLASLGLAQATKSKSDSTSKAPAAQKAEPAAKAAKAPQIDINSASKDDLMKLPGIGTATADKIIAGRPYSNKAQLKSKKILSDAEYDKISAQIIAKKADTGKAPSAAPSKAPDKAKSPAKTKLR
jgi:competence protein ComEA